MFNDDDKDKSFEGQEESEYHFSDDEASYEVEPEPEPTKPVIAPEEGPKTSFLNKLTQSKRMLISGAVFILLIFVVYKMVTPTVTPTPSTDITLATVPKPMPQTAPVSPAPTQQAAAPAQAETPPRTNELATTAPLQTPGAPEAQPTVTPPAQPALLSSTAAPTTTTPQTMTTQNLPSAAPGQGQTKPIEQATTLPAPGGSAIQPTVPSKLEATQTAAQTVAGTQGVTPPSQVTMPAAPGLPQAGSAMMQATGNAMTQATNAIAQSAEIGKANLPSAGVTPAGPSMTTKATPTTSPLVPGIAEQRRAAEQAAAMASIPAVIPVQSPIPTTVATSTIQEPTLPKSPSALAEAGTLQTPLSEKAQTDLITLQTQSEKLMNQLQADYSRKLNEYASQNRALQDQMQNLNARVAGMESQLTQLLQVLMRPHEAAREQKVPVAEVEQRVTYNVQAIIPGRAWLKSQSGETVTVAEGDVVRDLGRITKIDPYDGVVEINTGNKVVALSYGNGG